MKEEGQEEGEVIMLSKAQEKLIKSLHSKKGRQKNGLCLVEGRKVVELAGDLVEYVFGAGDSEEFKKLVTTETPQDVAAVARIPKWSAEDVLSRDVVVVLDGVQDPGNVGSILRLCLGFGASLVLVESADVTSPKVIRSSVGAMFVVPWVTVARGEAEEYVVGLGRDVYRLEKVEGAKEISKAKMKKPLVLVAGSEGKGIMLGLEGKSVFIDHNEKLESLNVGHALAIALAELRH